MTDSTVEKSGGFNPAQYFREVRGEMRKVTWLTRPETWRLTGIVLAVTAAMTALLFAFDYLFSKGLETLVNLFLGI